MVHLWTRDGHATVRQGELNLYYNNGSVGSVNLWDTNFGVRPAYAVDLNAIDWEIIE